MPLIKSTSKKAFQKNVEKEIKKFGLKEIQTTLQENEAKNAAIEKQVAKVFKSFGVVILDEFSYHVVRVGVSQFNASVVLFFEEYHFVPAYFVVFNALKHTTVRK